MVAVKAIEDIEDVAVDATRITTNKTKVVRKAARYPTKQTFPEPVICGQNHLVSRYDVAWNSPTAILYFLYVLACLQHYPRNTENILTNLGMHSQLFRFRVHGWPVGCFWLQNDRYKSIGQPKEH